MIIQTTNQKAHNLLTFDPSGHTGYAVMTGTFGNERIIEAGELILPEAPYYGGLFGRRLVYLREAVGAIAYRHRNIDAVLVECPEGAWTTQAVSMRVLVKLTGIIEFAVMAAYRGEVPCLTIDPNVWHGDLIGKTNHDGYKAMSLAIARNIKGVDGQPVEIKTDNVADAVCLGRFGFLIYRQGGIEHYLKQRETRQRENRERKKAAREEERRLTFANGGGFRKGGRF